MDNAYVQMIVDARNKLGVSTADLCEGICMPKHFYKVEKDERELSRTIAECFLARLGVDSGNYERYVDYPEYDIWINRMKIINCIEANQLDEALELINKYMTLEQYSKNKSRSKLESQFVMFMRLQIMKHKENGGSKESITKDTIDDIENKQKMYETALKLTVPDIDKKRIGKLLLSPLEFILVLEYKRIKYAQASVTDKWNMYNELLDYIHKSPMGKVSMVKVYPKTLVTMYRDIKQTINIEDNKNNENTVEIYRMLFKYCENALESIRQRKFMYYLTEILEIKLELLEWFEKNDREIYEANGYKRVKDETQNHHDVLIGLYKEYGVSCYMLDDCYLCRESGVYCINEVVKIRRGMLGLTQAELAGTDIAESTIWRIESKKQAVSHKIAKKLFDRLNLYPSCINMGIVTDKKEVLYLYEELRYAINSFEFERAREMIEELKAKLPRHVINEQMLERTESFIELRMGNIDYEEYTKRLIKALECTISLSAIEGSKRIFVTTEELKILYLRSAYFKDLGQTDKALIYIKKLYEYCMEYEEKGFVDEIIGIYELVMSYVTSLYGDKGRFKESNDISEKLIRMSLKFRRCNRVHSNMYNIAWNNDASKNSDYDYNAQVQRCIHISRLLGDTNDERFYIENLKPTE